jgi:hypothetical protein
VSGLSVWLLALVPVIAIAAVSGNSTEQIFTPRPSPEIAPATVVRIQVEALRHNSLLNEGIQLTYRFASPENKKVTGPLTRFTEMLRSSPYDRLLNHRSARYGPIAVSADQAHQVIMIIDKTGQELVYYWLLSRQDQGEFEGCWMTDAVIAVTRPEQRQVTQLPPLHPSGMTAAWITRFAHRASDLIHYYRQD